ncbi:MAG: terminase small subunit [Proteobacteria bacterium]|nr:terminase small subunit [Pseudomonadota bacterium]
MKRKPSKRPHKHGTHSLAAPSSKKPALPVGHFKLEDGQEVITGAVLAKYQLFVNGVLSHGNLTQASIEAGFVCPSKGAQRLFAQKLMTVPRVREMLRDQYQSLTVKSGVTVERVWAELARIAFSDIGNCSDEVGIRALHEMPEDVRRAIVGYKSKRTIIPGEDGDTVTEEREVKLFSKTDAIEKLMRLLNIGQAAQASVIVSPEAFLQAMEEGRRRAIEHRSTG